MKKTAAIALILAVMLSLSTCTGTKEDPDTARECLQAMVEAACRGDCEAGLAAEKQRNLVLDKLHSDAEQLSFDELFTLACFITSQANGEWLSEQLRLCVGEVALNRVASPLFPDDIEGVAADYGLTPEALRSIRPHRSCVNAALALLQGKRLMSPEVLYFSEKKVGTPFATFYNRLRGYTYFLTAEE